MNKYDTVINYIYKDFGYVGVRIHEVSYPTLKQLGFLFH